ncbi:MAG: RNA polymerase sigma factor [Polyangiaceae bacterium]
MEIHADASVLDGSRPLDGGDERASPAPAVKARVSAEALFRAHARFVASFVFRLGVDRESVDDVVQEVFLTAHRRGGFEEGPARPTTWLAEIALRVVSTHRRSDRRRRVHPDEAALNAAISDADRPDETAEHRSSLRVVERALGAIDVDKRAVFILFEIEGASTEDIAAGLGIPLGTVYSRLHTARKEFQKAYERLTGATAKSKGIPR